MTKLLTIRPASALALVAAAAMLVATATVPASAMSRRLNADGDSCTIDRDGLKIPGTMKGLECCNVFHPDDCVVVLKPFPSLTRAARFN